MRTVRNVLSISMAAVGLSFVGPVFAGDSLDPQTAENLKTAMHGEAFAHLKYSDFAKKARESGHPELAKLFNQNSKVEAYEHFAREADAAGLVESDKQNLLGSMAQEHYENTKMYVSFAKQADNVGDNKVADMFRQIAADEGDHYTLYKRALKKLNNGEMD
ncbi:rubrerythrin [Onishia taeanensis]|uniref:Rubrerythrin n=1 Tax=Onishia taeanensis TaxID=284577 RepID=A0A328XQK9_9GAMM|nr:rubrerythrin family protein [Halomonas taeanensis]RAR61438.1 rubrerythrin [Halomonas taeanensis]